MPVPVALQGAPTPFTIVAIVERLGLGLPGGGGCCFEWKCLRVI